LRSKAIAAKIALTLVQATASSVRRPWREILLEENKRRGQAVRFGELNIQV
jgi:hypothetical protein